MQPVARTERFRVAHASRVLAKASRLCDLFRKIVSARRRNQTRETRVLPGAFLLAFLLSCNALAQEIATAGYGPRTSVPVETTMTRRTPIPRRNWIDQT